MATLREILEKRDASDVEHLFDQVIDCDGANHVCILDKTYTPSIALKLIDPKKYIEALKEFEIDLIK